MDQLSVKEAANCRVCNTTLSTVMSLGQQPIAQAFVAPGEEHDLLTYELKPAICPACHLFQLMNVPAADRLFHAHYPYRTGTSRAMSRHFARWANEVSAELDAISDPLVVEIGSNDGTFLSNFFGGRIRCLGVEPASAAASIAQSKGVTVVQDFFCSAVASRIRAEFGPADRIFGANVVAHIADIRSVADGVKALLKDDGLFVFEAVYLGNVVENVAFDQIYDEHVFTFSVEAVRNVFSRFGLDLCHVVSQPTHGGSMRYTLANAGTRPVDSSVFRALSHEHEVGLDRDETFARFKRRCETIREDLRNLLENLTLEGSRVCGYGATSKSTTLFNYCGIDSRLIYGVYDNTPEKQGKLTPRSRVPIRSSDLFASEAGDLSLLLAWNHRKEIDAKEAAFRARGGRWILYNGEVRIE